MTDNNWPLEPPSVAPPWPDVEPVVLLQPTMDTAPPPPPVADRGRRGFAFAAVAGVVLVLAAGAFGAHAYLTRDTLVIPSSLGGLRQTTDSTLQVIASGSQDQMRKAMGGDGEATAVGYGDVTHLALLILIKSTGKAMPTADTLLANIATGVDGRQVAVGSTTALSSSRAEGDTRCRTETLTTPTTTKDIATLCARVHSDVAVVVLTQPISDTGTSARVDEALAAQQ